MCGITGIYFSQLKLDEQARSAMGVKVREMTSTLSLRGPDGSGVFVSNEIALGHTRLSILDTSDAGAQPMTLPDAGITLTYNGESYNFQALRQELESLGSTFLSGSDTEVVLHAYSKWGLQGLKKLEGIFALALWDNTRKRLVLMRDRFGVKPLYYGDSTFGLAFGSEIKAVLSAGGVNLTMDDQALSEYLWFGNTHQERSFYSGVRQLEPGHWMIIDEGCDVVVESWWRVEEWLDNDISELGKRATTLEVTKKLDTAVGRQLISDVPVGLFLSGGIDSSAIAASVGQNHGRELSSFSAEFDFSGSASELKKAALVARSFNLRHSEIKISGNDLSSTILEMSKAHDEPFADAANLALYSMCKQLPDNIKVVLQGDGGDELFGGYRRYAMLRNSKLWRAFPQFLARGMHSLGSKGRRFSRIVETLGHEDPALVMAFLLTIETNRLPPERFFTKEKRDYLLNTTDPFIAYRHANDRFKDHDIVQKMLLTDLTTQLPSQFLPKVDRATMAAGIEARVPFLDESLVKLAINIPSQWKTQGVEKKIILRDSQRSRLPKSILDAPKSGFGVPYQQWLRTSLYEFARETILDGSTISRWSLDASALEVALSEHKRGDFDHGFILWKVLQLALFNPSENSIPSRHTAN
jgi:asparagine synthase (glutamine-hydrolysing)